MDTSCRWTQCAYLSRHGRFGRRKSVSVRRTGSRLQLSQRRLDVPRRTHQPHLDPTTKQRHAQTRRPRHGSTHPPSGNNLPSSTKCHRRRVWWPSYISNISRRDPSHKHNQRRLDHAHRLPPGLSRTLLSIVLKKSMEKHHDQRHHKLHLLPSRNHYSSTRSNNKKSVRLMLQLHHHF